MCRNFGTLGRSKRQNANIGGEYLRSEKRQQKFESRDCRVKSSITTVFLFRLGLRD